MDSNDINQHKRLLHPIATTHCQHSSPSKPTESIKVNKRNLMPLRVSTHYHYDYYYWIGSIKLPERREEKKERKKSGILLRKEALITAHSLPSHTYTWQMSTSCLIWRKTSSPRLHYYYGNRLVLFPSCSIPQLFLFLPWIFVLSKN